MSEKQIIILTTIDMVLMLVVVTLLALILVAVKTDPLDVNRDGVANIVDLSVLAAELNERGQ